jgi:hypothetical protein
MVPAGAHAAAHHGSLPGQVERAKAQAVLHVTFLLMIACLVIARLLMASCQLALPN